STGKKLMTFQGHSGLVSSVAMSLNGKEVVTGSNDKTAILWEVLTGKKRQSFHGHTNRVSGVAISPDGNHVWTASQDGTTRLWSTSTGKELCSLLTFDAGKDWLVITPDGFFDGSPGAWRHVAYRETGTLHVIADDATRKRFHRPGLLAKIVKGEKL